jgi:hypothetical protein
VLFPFKASLYKSIKKKTESFNREMKKDRIAKSSKNQKQSQMALLHKSVNL